MSSPRWLFAAAVAGLAVLALAAYSNSFAVPFFFDDLPAVLNNPTIRDLSTAFSPPSHGGTFGRPVANFSLGINYAISGTSVWSYHVANLAIHVLAGLVLFGIVRRTLLLPCLRTRFGSAALPLAFLIAAIWVVHPLQTETVTCVIQRTESLTSLFFLLSLYGFIRGQESEDWSQKKKRAGSRPLASDRRQVRPLLSMLNPVQCGYCIPGTMPKSAMESCHGGALQATRQMQSAANRLFSH